MSSPEQTRPRTRVAVVVEDSTARRSTVAALQASPALDVVAWADSLAPLLVLGTLADVCLCSDPPPEDDAARLSRHGCVVTVQNGDPVTSVLAATARRGAPVETRRPHLSPRQRDVLIAYVSSGDLLPTVARGLGMDTETAKTHLRRIRAKYAAAARPAPIRRDLYARALEDGLIRPPSR